MRDSGAASYSSNSHRPRSAALARNRSSAGRRTTACVGTLAGMLMSLALSRWMGGITPSSGSPALWVWLAAALALAGVVTVASVLPARCALMTNPLTIMHDDT